MKYSKDYFLTHEGKSHNFSQIRKVCITCGSEFMIQKHRENTAKYCSKKCNKGYKLSEETKRKMSMSRTGNKHPNFGKKATPELIKKLRDSHIGQNKGDKHPQWKGGYEWKIMTNRQRRVMKLGNGGSHTFDEWNDLKKFYNYMCLCCKKFEPEITLSEDHIIPLSKGGTDNIENIQPLCRQCNSKKFTKTIRYKN